MKCCPRCGKLRYLLGYLRRGLRCYGCAVCRLQWFENHGHTSGWTAWVPERYARRKAG